jgi:hypothetical protein
MHIYVFLSIGEEDVIDTKTEIEIFVRLSIEKVSAKI